MHEIESFIKERLSAKRFNHSKGVAVCAENLAGRYKADGHSAYLAGLVHDCAKELPLEEMNKITANLELEEMIRESKNLLHGPAGAVFAKNNFNISDEVYDACFYHTVGKEKMSLLTKIVFIADMIEPGRSFEGVEEIRSLAFEDIDRAVVLAIDTTLKFLIKKGEKIYPGTVKARNFLIKPRLCDTI